MKSNQTGKQMFHQQKSFEGWNWAKLIGRTSDTSGSSQEMYKWSEASWKKSKALRISSMKWNSCVATHLPFAFLRHFAFASDFISRLMRNRRDSVRMVTLNITSPKRINWVPISLMTVHAEESSQHCRVPRLLEAGEKLQTWEAAKKKERNCVDQFILMETKTRFWAKQIFTLPSNVYVWQFFHSISIKVNIDKGMVWFYPAQAKPSFYCREKINVDDDAARRRMNRKVFGSHRREEVYVEPLLENSLRCLTSLQWHYT